MVLYTQLYCENICKLEVFLDALLKQKLYYVNVFKLFKNKKLNRYKNCSVMIIS